MWLAVISKPKEEYRATRELQNQGATVFLPECLARRPQKGATAFRDVLTPLFPGYLFAALNGVSVRSVLNTRGVRGVVKYGSGEPIWMREREMQALMAICGAVVDMRPQAARLHVGMNIVVKHGPFAGLSGTIVEILKNELKITHEVSENKSKFTFGTKKENVAEITT